VIAANAACRRSAATAPGAEMPDPDLGLPPDFGAPGTFDCRFGTVGCRRPAGLRKDDLRLHARHAVADGEFRYDRRRRTHRAHTAGARIPDVLRVPSAAAAAGLTVVDDPEPTLPQALGAQGGSVLGGHHVSQYYIGNLKRRLRDVGFSGVRISGSGRVSAILGRCIPVRAVYGSYLATAKKW
jgi:hypothetical protein